MAISTSRALQPTDESHPACDTNPGQWRRCYQWNRSVASAITRKTELRSTVTEITSPPRRFPISVRKGKARQTGESAATGEGQKSSIFNGRPAVLRKAPPQHKERRDGFFLQKFTTLESTSAVTADILTRSFKGGWRRRRRRCGGSREDEAASKGRNKSSMPVGMPTPGASYLASASDYWKGPAGESSNMSKQLPSIVVSAPARTSSIKKEPCAESQSGSYIWVEPDVDHSEWDHSGMLSDIENLSLSDASLMDELPSYEDAEMDFCEDEVISVPDLEYSDESEMEGDSYWEWDCKRRQFRHWDEERHIYVYCPREFS